ncbi:TRC40/GET3/ArsA family transport-energizing ATPase [Methanosphaera sp. WGK6]|uniref:ArsA family ATPase n=1 Tax=Methanosphaera sp. WGK6 TaxID=1561964 RepID=UPI00084C8559|nr:TRC40/GET3/ArsA family transport-energizing ATPase [Methanosphaera sp. WGK6]OED29583.1 arsenic ABC transporter ATPase [Methanosphaera sp. WGK6]
MAFTDLVTFNKKKTTFIFIGGKGGVGKTTVSAATALWCARMNKKTLIISTDPAHSLGDSFDRLIKHVPTPITHNLEAIEIDPDRAMEEYKTRMQIQQKYNDALGMFTEQMDAMSSSPGIDEIASFDKFMQYMNNDEYDVIIFDTAPTGHTLRLLSFPEMMDSWVGKLIKTRKTLGAAAKKLKNIIPFMGSDDDDLENMAELEEMKKEVIQAREILTDSSRTTFKSVLIPEEMSIIESSRAIEALNKSNITTDGIIVNKIQPDNNHCEFCKARRKIQEKRLDTIRATFEGQIIAEIPLQAHEVRGIDQLYEICDILYGSDPSNGPIAL